MCYYSQQRSQSEGEGPTALCLDFPEHIHIQIITQACFSGESSAGVCSLVSDVT